MADFNVFLPKLLRFEGGWVDDPADPGGATNKGITLATFASVARPLLEIEPTRENLRQLSDDQAARIYRKLYWNKLNADEIGLQALAEIYVDFYVNAGANAVRLMQRCLNTTGAVAPSIAVDGVHGNATRAALLDHEPTALYRRYRDGRIAYYHELAEKRPTLQRFLKGWLNRVDAFPEL